jgi:antitoxin (DNA-binding transcriptional repressor) of toxin-antitoxin stability system
MYIHVRIWCFLQEKNMTEKPADKTVDVNDARMHFSDLLNDVQRGMHVYLKKNKRLVAQISPIPGGARIPGLHQGKVRCSDDFDAPLPAEFWEGR